MSDTDATRMDQRGQFRPSLWPAAGAFIAIIALVVHDVFFGDAVLMQSFGDAIYSDPMILIGVLLAFALSLIMVYSMSTAEANVDE